jgi:HK97 gp10 family phage protein
MKVTVSVRGLRELDEALRLLPDDLQAVAIRPGVRQAGKVLAAGMEARAPRSPVPEPPTLAEEIVVSTSVSTRRDIAVAHVGPSREAFYGGFQEFGTRFQDAQPFMRPTLEADGQLAINALIEGVKDGLQKAVHRLGTPTR